MQPELTIADRLAKHTQTNDLLRTKHESSSEEQITINVSQQELRAPNHLRGIELKRGNCHNQTSATAAATQRQRLRSNLHKRTARKRLDAVPKRKAMRQMLLKARLHFGAQLQLAGRLLALVS